MPIEGPRGELRLLRGRRRVGEAGARAHARPLVREPAGAARDVRRRLHRRHDHEPRDARSDPGRDRHGEQVRPPAAASPARRTHRPCAPRSGRARASRPTRPRFPSSHDVRRARRSCGRRSSTTCRCIRTPARRCCPRCAPRSDEHGWLSPRGDAPGRRGDARHARLPGVGRELLRHARAASPVGRHTIYICTNLSCQLRGAQRRARRALARRPASPVERVEPRRRVPPARVRMPGRVRHRADGVDRGPLPRAADARGRGARSPSTSAPAAHAADLLPERRYVGDYGAGRARRTVSMAEQILFKHVDEPGLQPDRGLRAPRRLPRRCARR